MRYKDRLEGMEVYTFTIKGYAVCAMILVLMAITLSASTTASTIQVISPSEVSLQQLIDDANESDVINVGSGTYIANLTIDRAITLKGVDTGDGLPHLDAGGNSYSVVITANDVTVDGFYLENLSRESDLIDDVDILEGIKVVSSNNTLTSINGPILVIGDNNNLTGNEGEINLVSSTGNYIVKNTGPIGLFSSKDNIMIYNKGDIGLFNSGYNTLSHNDGKIILNLSVGNGISNNLGLIILRNSSHNTVAGEQGSVTLLYSSDNLVTGSQVTSGNVGIAFVNSHNNTITGNKASNTLEAGISVLNGTRNNLVGNVVSSNSGAGILLGYSDNNTLSRNIANGNGVGLLLTGCYNNILYQNNMLQNVNYNAYDDGTNRWDTSSSGNRYSDHSCIDADSDGFCDSAYMVPGGLNEDHYPLASWQVR